MFLSIKHRCAQQLQKLRKLTANQRARPFLFAGLLCACLLTLRYGIIENGLLPHNCGPDGRDSALPCGLTWLLIQSFHAQRIGIFALIFATIGFLTNSRRCALIAWFAGITGMVLYSPDYAAPAMLLALFTLLRRAENT